MNIDDDWNVNDIFRIIDYNVSWLMGTVFEMLTPPSIKPITGNLATVAG